LLVGLFAAGHAWTKGPYVQHVDEHLLLGASHKMLKSGDYDPQWYRYGSVSIHLCALGEAIGYVDAARKVSWIPVTDLPDSIVPLARPSRLASWPRLLFALLGGGAALLAGLCADRLRPRSFAGPLTILLLASHAVVQEQWYGYLNVNIVAAFFALAGIWAHLSADRTASWLRASAVPAVFWGLAAAAKYPLGIGVLAVVVFDLLQHPRRHPLLSLGTLGVAVGAFLVAMPFALTNSPRFLSDLAFELNHYATGHRDFTSEPGVESAWHHVTAWLVPYGPVALAAVVGVVATVRHAPRALLALVLPATALLVLLALQATNFIRNSLLLGYVFAVLAAVGVAVAQPWLLERASRLEAPLLRRAGARQALVALPLLALLLATQWRGYAHHFGRHAESRDQLELVLRTLPPGSKVAIPHPDFMSSRSAELVSYDPTAPAADALAELARSQADYAVVPRKWARSRFRSEADVMLKLAHAEGLRIPGRSVWRGGVDEEWVHWPYHPRSNPLIELVALDHLQLAALIAQANATPPHGG